MKKQRLFYLDLIRAVALVCILVIHFNAAVTGYFTLPSKLFGSVLPFNIYLGDFGSSLFFMVSGAALQYTSPGQGREPLNLARFYQKRAKAVYPMFWLAWCIFFPIRFVTKPGYYAAAKTPSLLLTVLGLDNFAQAAGWVTMDFACVGEWFLGSILFLYLLFPLLRWGLRKQPLLTWAVVLAASLPVHYMGWDARLVAIHIPEFLLGMAFVHWKRLARLGVLAGCAVLLFTPAAADGKVACALFSAAAFILLAVLGGCIHWVPLQNACALLSKYSYAVFLTHHVIILRLVDNFDLAAMTRRDTALLFGVYLLAVAAASAARWNTYAKELLRPFAEVNIVVAGAAADAALLAARLRQSVDAAAFRTAAVSGYREYSIYNQPWKLARALKAADPASLRKWAADEVSRIFQLPVQGSACVVRHGHNAVGRADALLFEQGQQRPVEPCAEAPSRRVF